MSMYNILFGKNPESAVVLATLGLSQTDVPRFRDCCIAEGEIVVYTRMGGGNYECWGLDEVKDPCDCFFCAGVLKNMEGHPNYLRGVDDAFDCTYRTFYFTFPNKYKEGLKALDIGVSWDPDERWQDLLCAMNEEGEGAG